MKPTNHLNSDSGPQSPIDLKYLLHKITTYWKLFLVSIIIALSAAKFKNGYEEKSYSIGTTISIKDEQQTPGFSSSTNIAFNWGGESNNVETIKTRFKSRTHNEKVTKKLKFYIEYLMEGPYRFNDVYGSTPFTVQTETKNYQITNQLIGIQFLTNEKIKISVDFKDISARNLMEYDSNKSKKHAPNKILFEKTFDISEHIKTPFCDFNITKIGEADISKKYYVRFNDVGSIAAKYRSISIRNLKSGTSLLGLTLTGTNKARLVDYLNTSVEILNKDHDLEKVTYAIKTKNYIDTLSKKEKVRLDILENKIAKFKDSADIYNIEAEGSRILDKILVIDEQKLNINRSFENIQSIRDYILSLDLTSRNIPVPSLPELNAPAATEKIGELTTLVILKNELEDAGITVNHPEMIDVKNRINLAKTIVINSLNSTEEKITKDLSYHNRRLYKFERELKKMPKLERKLLIYNRSYEASLSNYSSLQTQSYQAGRSIASNVSDIKVVDKAKDTGQGSSKPRTDFNYLVALMLSIIAPLFYIIIVQLLDDSIHDVEAIEKNYSIPVIGVIGSNTTDTNLAVFENPKSTISESYRALRSNLKFLFTNDNSIKTPNKNKTILITSSVSGEGKTMISINLATAFAMSGKKTIILGLDLRKPKIYEDFNLDNNVGVVNYLIGQKTIAEVTHKSHIPNLDVIVSGPIPPNPSELLITKRTSVLFSELKEEYDYVIIDTPPLGLVSDALDLLKFSDANIYVIRQDFSKRGMMKMVDDKYINGEIKNIGYILNDFSSVRKYGYGYGYGYGYSYEYTNNYHENEKQTLMDKLSSFVNRKNS